MKRLLSTLTLALFVAATSFAAGTRVCVNDTVVKVLRPDSIVVTETDSTTHVHVFGSGNNPSYSFDYSKYFDGETTTTVDEHTSDWDFNLPFGKYKKRRTTQFAVEGMAYMHLGAIVPVSKTSDVRSKVGVQAGLDVINLTANMPSHRDALSIGLGLELYMMKQKEGWQWVRRGGQLATIPFGEGVTHRHSLLASMSLTMPIHYSHSFKKTDLTFSVIPEWNMLTYISNNYHKGDSRINDRYRNDLNRRPLDVAFRINCTYNDAAGIYVQFNPYKSFTGVTSPNFKMLTVGFSF